MRGRVVKPDRRSSSYFLITPLEIRTKRWSCPPSNNYCNGQRSNEPSVMALWTSWNCGHAWRTKLTNSGYGYTMLSIEIREEDPIKNSFLMSTNHFGRVLSGLIIRERWNKTRNIRLIKNSIYYYFDLIISVIRSKELCRDYYWASKIIFRSKEQKVRHRYTVRDTTIPRSWRRRCPKFGHDWHQGIYPEGRCISTSECAWNLFLYGSIT